jgi:quinol monooxygenase YgiN
MAILAIAEMFGIAASRSELTALLARFEGEAAGHQGCRRYVASSALTEPDRFVIVSEWDDQAALDAHYASDAFGRFQFDLDGLLARPSEEIVYTVAEAVRPVSSGPMDPRDAD